LAYALDGLSHNGERDVGAQGRFPRSSGLFRRRWSSDFDHADRHAVITNVTVPALHTRH
jgi:hypothetical protein